MLLNHLSLAKMRESMSRKREGRIVALRVWEGNDVLDATWTGLDGEDVVGGLEDCDSRLLGNLEVVNQAFGGFTMKNFDH